jgi:hypothetical protein
MLAIDQKFPQKVSRSRLETMKMNDKKNLATLLLSSLVLIPILIFIENILPDTGNSEWSEVVFFVS